MLGSRTTPEAEERDLAALRTLCVEYAERAVSAEQQLQALRAQQQEFAANIGHELRNPLNGLCAALEVLEACGTDAPSVAEAAAVASRQAKRLVERVDELLPRSGGEPGKN